MFSGEQLTGLLCAALREPLLRLADSSPTAAAFGSDVAAIPAHTLARHSVEHVFRIRMFRQLDGAASQMLADRQPGVASKWAGYARSEAIHDRYFLKDLASLGLGRDWVEGIPAFDSTARLADFVGRAMLPYGALPVVLYSFWAEQNSEVGTPAVISRGQAVFGSDSTRGAAAHRALDIGQSHPALISEVLAALILNDADLVLAVGLLDAITGLLQEYFTELDAWSLLPGSRALLDPEIVQPVVAVAQPRRTAFPV